jgi:mono/diheme cytochrome c family protein
MSMRVGWIVLCAVAIISSASSQTKLKTVPAKPVAIGSGQAMYAAYCGSCHGKEGKGNGPAASAMKVPPSDLTMLSKQNKGVFPYAHVQHTIEGEAKVAAHGDKTMPVWGSLFWSMSQDTDEVHLRIANLTKYVEQIQAK